MKLNDVGTRRERMWARRRAAIVGSVLVAFTVGLALAEQPMVTPNLAASSAAPMVLMPDPTLQPTQIQTWASMGAPIPDEQPPFMPVSVSLSAQSGVFLPASAAMPTPVAFFLPASDPLSTALPMPTSTSSPSPQSTSSPGYLPLPGGRQGSSATAASADVSTTPTEVFGIPIH
jgi:hypothetical protein